MTDNYKVRDEFLLYASTASGGYSRQTTFPNLKAAKAAALEDGWDETEYMIVQLNLERKTSKPVHANILGRPIEGGIDLQGIMAEVARHYMNRAVEHTNGNKTEAAKMLGLASYQTLTNWMKKYSV